MTSGRLLAIGLGTALVVAACGKTGAVAPAAGVYHLTESGEPTNLELRPDGTFTVRRESCESIGDLECGIWMTERTGTSHVVPRDGQYWPTPETFPSAVIRRLSLRPHGQELVIVGDSEWAGSFTQRWVPGRTCAVCREKVSSGGATSRVTDERPCASPLPECSLP